MPRIKQEIERIKKLRELDFSAPETQQEVFSLLETLCGIILAQQREIEELKDEINRLKGEKGKPNFGPKKEASKEPSKDKMPNINERKPWAKSSKKEKVKIDREEVIRLDAGLLPPDAVFKGYEEKIVQNIVVKTDNVLYKLEKYYSPSEGKTYIATPGESVKGTEYGPETKALISSLYYENRVTENRIVSFLNSNGMHISEGTVSNILIKDQSEALSDVKQKIFEAEQPLPANRRYRHTDKWQERVCNIHWQRKIRRVPHRNEQKPRSRQNNLETPLSRLV
jgi:hypothetical protein